MKNLLVRLLALFWVTVMISQAWGGTWTANQFAYKPRLGARGAEAKARFDSGLDRIDNRLGQVKYVGDPATGYATFTDAVTTLNNSGGKCTLVVPRGTHDVNTNLTVNDNINLAIQKGAILSVKDGQTLTIKGLIQAGPWQIFACSGTGKVRLNDSLPQIYADWWIADPTNATTTTAEIKAAVDSVNYLTDSHQMNNRPPVVLTKEKYQIANLSFDQSTGTYYTGLTLIGKPGAGNKGNYSNNTVTLEVTGAGNNGILISGNYSATPDYVNCITLENLAIKKVSYPGDDNNDYGLNLRLCEYITLRNVSVAQFGGEALRIEQCYIGSFYDFQAWDGYRAINFVKCPYGVGYACTTMNFINPVIMGCTYYLTSDGNATANFRGLTSDDHASRQATNYFNLTNDGNNFSFTDCWFEGLASGNKAINLGDGATYPQYSLLSFRGCRFYSVYAPDYMFSTAGSGTAIVNFNSCACYYVSSGANAVYLNTSVVPNDTGADSCRSVLNYNDGTFGTYGGPKIYMSSPTTNSSSVPTVGHAGTAIVEDEASSWDGIFNMRFYDNSHSISSGTVIDGIQVGIDGVKAPSLFIRRYNDTVNYQSLHISAANGPPATQTCNTSATTPYKLTNLTGWDTFCQGDQVVITGAGAGGTDLTTTIIYINYNGSIVYIKNPVQATLTGANINLVGVKGAVRLNYSPEAGEPKEWICTTAGTPGTWVVGGQAGYRTHAGAPTETPYFIGEELLDTTNGKWYKAKGLTSSDWVALN